MGRCASGGFCWGLVLGFGFEVLGLSATLGGLPVFVRAPRIVSALHASPFGVLGFLLASALR